MERQNVLGNISNGPYPSPSPRKGHLLGPQRQLGVAGFDTNPPSSASAPFNDERSTSRHPSYSDNVAPASNLRKAATEYQKASPSGLQIHVNDDDLQDGLETENTRPSFHHTDSTCASSFTPTITHTYTFVIPPEITQCQETLLSNSPSFKDFTTTGKVATSELPYLARPRRPRDSLLLTTPSFLSLKRNVLTRKTSTERLEVPDLPNKSKPQSEPLPIVQYTSDSPDDNAPEFVEKGPDEVGGGRLAISCTRSLTSLIDSLEHASFARAYQAHSQDTINASETTATMVFRSEVDRAFDTPTPRKVPDSVPDPSSSIKMEQTGLPHDMAIMLDELDQLAAEIKGLPIPSDSVVSCKNKSAPQLSDKPLEPQTPRPNACAGVEDVSVSSSK